MPLPGNALKSAVFADVHAPIWPSDYRSVFEGVISIGEELPPHTKGCGVPKTLELRTTVRRAGIRGKMRKSMFLNCVLKPVTVS